MLRADLKGLAQNLENLRPVLNVGVHLADRQRNRVVVQRAGEDVHVFVPAGEALVRRLDPRGAEERKIEAFLALLLEPFLIEVVEHLPGLAQPPGLHVGTGDAVEELRIVVRDLLERLELVVDFGDGLLRAQQFARKAGNALQAFDPVLPAPELLLGVELERVVRIDEAVDPHGIAVLRVREHLVARLQRRHVQRDAARRERPGLQQQRDHRVHLVDLEILEVRHRQHGGRPIAPVQVGGGPVDREQERHGRTPLLLRKMAAGHAHEDVDPEIERVLHFLERLLVGLERILVLALVPPRIADEDADQQRIVAELVLLLVGLEGRAALGELREEEMAQAETEEDALHLHLLAVLRGLAEPLDELLQGGNRLGKGAGGQRVHRLRAHLLDRILRGREGRRHTGHDGQCKKTARAFRHAPEAGLPAVRTTKHVFHPRRTDYGAQHKS